MHPTQAPRPSGPRSHPGIVASKVAKIAALRCQKSIESSLRIPGGSLVRTIYAMETFPLLKSGGMKTEMNAFLHTHVRFIDRGM